MIKIQEIVSTNLTISQTCLNKLNPRMGVVMNSNSESDIDPKLLEILVCPLTKGPLVYDKNRNELISNKARLAYPVRDGIPVMLIDEARKLENSE